MRRIFASMDRLSDLVANAVVQSIDDVIVMWNVRKACETA